MASTQNYSTVRNEYGMLGVIILGVYIKQDVLDVKSDVTQDPEEVYAPMVTQFLERFIGFPPEKRYDVEALRSCALGSFPFLDLYEDRVRPGRAVIIAQAILDEAMSWPRVR